MTSQVPYWVQELLPGDSMVVCFPYTGSTVYAHILENCPNNDKNLFGTITIKYLWNNVAREEDLLYDDYSKESVQQSNWYAYPVI